MLHVVLVTESVVLCPDAGHVREHGGHPEVATVEKNAVVCLDGCGVVREELTLGGGTEWGEIHPQRWSHNKVEEARLEAIKRAAVHTVRPPPRIRVAWVTNVLAQTSSGRMPYNSK